MKSYILLELFGDVFRVVGNLDCYGEAVISKATVPTASPVPMILTCPQCTARHIDEGEFATKAHHTHACQTCGAVWRPAIIATVGVRFLPGFKNDTEPIWHLTLSPGVTRCGADYSNMMVTDVRANVTCDFCAATHNWRCSTHGANGSGYATLSMAMDDADGHIGRSKTANGTCSIRTWTSADQIPGA